MQLLSILAQILSKTNELSMSLPGNNLKYFANDKIEAFQIKFQILENLYLPL